MDLILARDSATSPLSALRLITPSNANPTPRATAEGQMFSVASEGESIITDRLLANPGSSSLEILNGLTAAQGEQPAAETLLPSTTLSKLGKTRFGLQ